MQADASVQPWYKFFWAWFIVAILAASVVLGLTLVVIAVKHQDTLVADNYYEAGKGINRSLERERLAKQLQIRAEIQNDDLTGDVIVRLSGQSQPERLTLNLISPTQPEKDRQLELMRNPSDPNLYTGQLTDPVDGRRFVEILGEENGQPWRLFEEEFVQPGGALRIGDEPLKGAEATRP